MNSTFKTYGKEWIRSVFKRTKTKVNCRAKCAPKSCLLLGKESHTNLVLSDKIESVKISDPPTQCHSFVDDSLLRGQTNIYSTQIRSNVDKYNQLC